MYPRATNTTVPPISTPATRQLARTITVIERRRPALVRLAMATPANDELLRPLAMRASNGDADTATVVIWAMLPRLCAMIRSRMLQSAWPTAVDDYLTIMYLVLRDLEPETSAAYLSDRILARSRRRFERRTERHLDEPIEFDRLEAALTSGSAVEDQALARIELGQLIEAVDTGLLNPDVWARHLDYIGRDPNTPATGAERMRAMRTVHRLRQWRDEQAA